MAEDCEDKKKERMRHLAGEQAFELKLKENKLRPSFVKAEPCHLPPEGKPQSG